MKSICKLIILSFLIVVTFVFNTGFAYAVPQIFKGADVSTVASVISVPTSTYVDPSPSARAVHIQTKVLPDGIDTKVTVEPSLKGALAGATGGAAVGSYACVASGIAAPVAPLCGATGALIGGTVGLVLGPSD